MGDHRAREKNSSLAIIASKFIQGKFIATIVAMALGVSAGSFQAKALGLLCLSQRAVQMKSAWHVSCFPEDNGSIGVVKCKEVMRMDILGLMDTSQ